MVSVALKRSPTVPLKTPLHGHNSLRMSRVIGLDSLDYVIDDNLYCPVCSFDWITFTK